ncbi:sulfatase [uncultured Roseobacter sp.]|uniref:sulfatase n=1 Tax=uncultured Roseobacter sp. TaxID=114847 RepID=UPI002612AF18|nr:sulfatase [uncultured Roseobacter sp.]
MNIVLVLVDSLTRNCLQAYAPDSPCRTPNIDRLAARAHVFDNHFVGSLPCMPARRELIAGRKEFMWRPWGSLEVFDPRLPSEVKTGGYHTHIVTDHYHYWEEEANGYIQSYDTTEMIRGYEVDHWQRQDPHEEKPVWVRKVEEFRAPEHIGQYYANVKDFAGEEDYFSAKTFGSACDWLDRHARKGKFFLHVETFDVHEPFDIPEPYESMYADGATKNEFNIWPPYQVYDDLNAFMDQTTREELAFLKSQFMGKVTMMDKWLGTLFDKLDEMALWEDTMVILTTDHGHDMGERRAFGKQHPHFDSHANIPLMIWHPKHPGNGTRLSGLTQTVDLFATLIEAAGVELTPANRHSRSLLPMITHGAPAPRRAVLYGTFGQGVCVTDGEWTLLKSPVPDAPLYLYSTAIFRPLIVDNPVDGRLAKPPNKPVDQGYFDPSVDLPMWKIPIEVDPRTDENFLFHRADDPDQSENLWERAPDARARMLRLMRELMDDEGFPPEQLARLGLEETVTA